MRRLTSLALGIGLPLTGLTIAIAASGWMYLLRPLVADWPGPWIRDALPFDELPGHDAVPLVVFLAVWAIAASLLGVLTRFAQLERLAAALLLALGLGLWLYLEAVLALYVTRGVPSRDVIFAAARIRAVYLPAALAGASGAILGRARGRGRPWTPTAVAIAVAAGGLLDILSAVTPELTERLSRLEALVPTGVPRVASAVVASAGVVLLLLARGLAKRKRRAWQLALGLLAASSLLHLAKGLDYEEAAVTGLLALVLIARRHDFEARGDPRARPKIAVRAAAFVVALYAYGAVALIINSAQADRPYAVGFAMAETTRALVTGGLSGSQHVPGRFGQWFPLSVALIGMAGVGFVVTGWLAPWRYRLRQDGRHRRLARTIVRAWGDDTLAPFALRADKSYFFTEDERGVLAYTVVAGVALVSGDPIGPPDALPGLVADFARFVHVRGWRVAILGASEDRLGTYRALGLRALHWGNEAVIDTCAFSLDGRAIRKVRQSVHRLERAGYTVEFSPAGHIRPIRRLQLEAITRAWQGGRRQHGFVMELDSLFRLGGDDAVFVIGRDRGGVPGGFLHFAVSHAGSALSLSSMPRLATTPNGFNEWLICETVAWAREHGFARLSLNFAAFATLVDPDAQLSGFQRLERDALLALRTRLQLQLDNLLQFAGKFVPAWQRRFVVYERASDLPRVGVAALAAEGYLPLGAKRAR